MKKVLVNDFCNYRFLAGIQYSPNDKCAAFVVSKANEKKNTYESNIFVYENGKTRQLTSMDKESGFFFEDDENILFATVRTDDEKEVSKSGDEVTNYYRINIHGGEARKAFDLPYRGGIIDRIDNNRLLIRGSIDVNYPDLYKMSKNDRKKVFDERKENKDYEVFDEWPFWGNGMGVQNKKRSALFIYDMKKKDSIRITEPTFSLGDVKVINDGIYYSGISYDALAPLTQNLYRYDIKTGKTKMVLDGKDYYGFGIEHVGDRILIFATDGKSYGLNENNFLYELDEKNGRLKLISKLDNNLYSSVGGDCSYGGGRQQRTTDRLYSVSTRRNASHIYSYDMEGNEEVVFDEEGAVCSFDIKKDNSEILFIGFLEQRLQELYSFKNGRLKKITNFNDAALKGRYVAKPEKINVTGCEFDVDGWILKPIDYDENKSYPAILEVHGGPKTVYGEIFHHEMQYLASSGYFVLFCNPKGSDGRGNTFADIRGEYGGEDYREIMAFTDACLKKYPQIDKNRLGETGGSYGGFMTNWIVGHTDRFACAATQRSISNWISFYGISDIGPYFSMDQTAGDIGDNMLKMWDESPLKYVDNVKTPLLFIHSDEDYRCPLSQGLQFYTALVNRKVPTRMCMFHGENHELSRSGKPKHRIRRLTEIKNWMDKYLMER